MMKSQRQKHYQLPAIGHEALFQQHIHQHGFATQHFPSCFQARMPGESQVGSTPQTLRCHKIEIIERKKATSNLCIQEHHCWPFPKGPPAKMLKMGSILAIAPPSFASTMPVRTMTTLFVLACCAAFSQSLHTSAR